MLDRRKAAILRAIVRDYIKSGHPLGSQAIQRRHRLNVSAATIRNDMALLEDLGYITQPHTSAGRIPTDLGYRWFVDNWPEPEWPPLPLRARKAIEALLRTDYRGQDEALDYASHVLSEVTEATAVVVAPPLKKNRLRRLELFPRDDGRATLLLIADSGEVEQGIVNIRETPAKQLQELGNRLSSELQGVAFEDLSKRIGKTRGEARDAIASEVARLIGERSLERVFRGGTANILSPEKFPDMAVAHEVVDALEHPSLMSRIVEAASRARSVVVLIGGEVPVRQMRSCAIVFARYPAGHDRHGTLGIVGPTRIDYPQTISAVEAVSGSLGSLLGSPGV